MNESLVLDFDVSLTTARNAVIEAARQWYHSPFCVRCVSEEHIKRLCDAMIVLQTVEKAAKQ